MKKKYSYENVPYKGKFIIVNKRKRDFPLNISINRQHKSACVMVMPRDCESTEPGSIFSFIIMFFVLIKIAMGTYDSSYSLI